MENRWISWILRCRRRCRKRHPAPQPCAPQRSIAAAQEDDTSSQSSVTPRKPFRFLDLPTELQLQVLSNLEPKQLRLMRCISRYINTFINEHASVFAAPFAAAARDRHQGFIDYWLDYSRGDIDLLEALSRFLWCHRISTDLTIMCPFLQAFTRFWVHPNPHYQRLEAEDPDSALRVFNDVFAITWFIFRTYIGFHLPDPAFALSQDRFINFCRPHMPLEGYGIDMRSLQKWYDMITSDNTTLPGVTIRGQGHSSNNLLLTRLNSRPPLYLNTQLQYNIALFCQKWDLPRFPKWFHDEFVYIVDTPWAWGQLERHAVAGKEVGPLEGAAVLMEMSIY